MMKKAQVVMLPTEKSRLVYNHQSKKLVLIDGILTVTNNVNVPQHLYFVTDDEIKEGDWITDNYTIYQVTLKDANAIKYHDLDRFKKIIATTNPDLWFRPLEMETWSYPFKIPTDFVEAYVREQGKITEVNLEYERFEYGVDNTKDPIHWRLKLRSNGTVIIHPVKEKMYTRQEVINFLLEYAGNDVEGVMEFVKYSLPQI